MKKLALLFLLLALAIGASAQAKIDFANLPDAPSPSPLPNGYGNLNWTGAFYVDPFKWALAGPGFKHREDIAGTDVAFGPGPCSGAACFASIGSSTGFQLVSALAAAPYQTAGPASPLIVTAYYNGQYIGTQTYMMTTDVQQLDFPPSWGVATQVIIQGSFVFYDLNVYTLGH